MLQRFKDVPNSGMPLEDQDKLMQVSLPIGGNTLMGTDAVGIQGKDYLAGNNFQLSVAVDSKDEAEKIFNGLAAGGEVKIPLQETFWAPAFGMLNDKFGIQWMVNYDGPQK